MFFIMAGFESLSKKIQKKLKGTSIANRIKKRVKKIQKIKQSGLKDLVKSRKNG